MLNKSENKKCPLCHKPMAKIVSGCSLTEIWKCNNPECKHEEIIEDYGN
jgi:ribosomal protein L37AE/L43A